MGFKRGAPKPANGGHKAGTPNRLTSDLREMIHTALHEAGGVAYLRRQADENPVAFMSLLGKILPQRIEGNVPLSPPTLDEERAEAIREIEEAFVSLRTPQPALIEAQATGGCRSSLLMPPCGGGEEGGDNRAYGRGFRY
jgi:hypothetical protein